MPDFPKQPSSREYAAVALANLHAELMVQLDLHKEKDAVIAELRAELAKLKNPESDGA